MICLTQQVLTSNSKQHRSLQDDDDLLRGAIGVCACALGIDTVPLRIRSSGRTVSNTVAHSSHRGWSRVMSEQSVEIVNGKTISAEPGEMVIACRTCRRIHSSVLLPPSDVIGRHVSPVPRRNRHRSRTDVAALVHGSGVAGHDGRHRIGHNKAGTGGNPRGCLQIIRSMPGVRQRWRMPTTRPGVQPRSWRADTSKKSVTTRSRSISRRSSCSTVSGACSVIAATFADEVAETR